MPDAGDPRRHRARAVWRGLLAALYLVAAWFHLTAPAPFLRIMPPQVPAPALVTMLTGIAEGLGAIALLQPWSRTLRKAGGIGLALYALCVFPANINHFALDMARPDHGLGLAYHVPRMIAQPLLIWLALWTGGATQWPFRRRDT
ncbi:MAG: DoxX family protein [Croceibacterium sp.]